MKMLTNKLSFTLKLSFTFLFIISLLFPKSTIAQSTYQLGWDAINSADIDGAIKHFESALEDQSEKESALLCLSLLHSKCNRILKASTYFKKYMETAADPYPALFALWMDDAVIGEPRKKEAHQLDLLKVLYQDENNKLERATLYHLFFHHRMSNDFENVKKVSKEIKTLDTWSFAGPFDNVMNNGFDKDFGPVKNPKKEAAFQSKYGATVHWFEPKDKSLDGYIFRDEHFYSSSSIFYGQSFVKLEKEEEVLLKIGYSGSLKLWVNDQLVYAEKEQRRTELDFYTVKVKLNKSYNRILFQLGDYSESTPSFSIRMVDLKGQDIDYEASANYQKYTPASASAESIPYFALQYLENHPKLKTDLLYQLLLGKSYMRAFDLRKAEQVYEQILEQHPKNYFALRNMVMLYDMIGNTTNQNKYYSLFEKHYANSTDILENDIEEALDQKNKDRYKEKVAIYLEKYPSRYKKLAYKLGIAGLEEDIPTILALTDTLFKYYPDDYNTLISKYKIEKEYFSKPDRAKKILLDYLENNYSYTILKELASVYIKNGQFEDAIKLFEDNHRYEPASGLFLRYIVNLLSRQQKYKEAIQLCEQVLQNNPSDYRTIQDIALLSQFVNDDEKALEAYESTLAYYPFSFEVNEKIRELKGMEMAKKFVEEVKPQELIKAYEAEKKDVKKDSYDIVLETKSHILFKSSALGIFHSYIIKVNDESAIERWQSVSFSSNSNFDFAIQEALTIKQNGEQIDAERNNLEVVFTNLEVGDYVFVSYSKLQKYGGKTTKFISDDYNLNSYSPSYKLDFHLYVEEGMPILEAMSKGTRKPKISKKDGFVHYNWSSTFPETLKEENYALPFNDVAEKAHFSVNQSWSEIVEWYSDLSSHQAEVDYTIENLAKDLLGDKSLSTDEKFHRIYDFVCKNIQYSSIDFRQSGYIPQKASNIYHSRLGDCKDVSTLFVSIARAAGLKANLVLINTSNNGQKSVILPSLNFNHCIVKAYLGNEEKYLELTDPNLPYGHLYYYHKSAPILEIPHKGDYKNAKLEYLDFNKNYESITSRITKLKVLEDDRMKVEAETVSTGVKAASLYRAYYNEDELSRKEKFKNYFASKFKSNISIDELNFVDFTPLEADVKYRHGYTVEKDILKLGSMKTFKIPFSDILIGMNLFEEGEREHDFDYVYYEDTEKYKESIEIVLPEKSAFIELPENVHLEFNKNIYDLKFEKINERTLKVVRTYQANRENIKAENFKAFKDFMTQVNEAENTHLLFK